ncbi:MAG: DUF3465 domain-containing protein [Methylococcaceae bacterium]|nr:DUF3465 domain-containing protein [Methylococcaceae bacterium]
MTYRNKSRLSDDTKRSNRLVLKIFLIVLLGICSAFLSRYTGNFNPVNATEDVKESFTTLESIHHAYENQLSNLQVKQSGRIIKILRDDDHGPRHQRFIIQLDSGQKLLIAHNIDLAPKVENLKEGEFILFYGEYEWNNKGGVVHWTHRDSKGLHPNGWLLYGNRKYD